MEDEVTGSYLFPCLAIIWGSVINFWQAADRETLFSFEGYWCGTKFPLIFSALGRKVRRPDLTVPVILGIGLRRLTPDGSYSMHTCLRHPCQVPLLSELKKHGAWFQAAGSVQKLLCCLASFSSLVVKSWKYSFLSFFFLNNNKTPCSFGKVLSVFWYFIFWRQMNVLILLS